MWQLLAACAWDLDQDNLFEVQAGVEVLPIARYSDSFFVAVPEEWTAADSEGTGAELSALLLLQMVFEKAGGVAWCL